MTHQKKWTPVLVAALLATALPASLPFGTPTAQAASSFSDISGHWATESILAGSQEGWLNGYADGSFRPEAPVTRAEFVKMIAAATKLTPGSATAAYLVENSRLGESVNALPDVKTSWLYEQGWYTPALSFGYIIPADYGTNFDPNRPITRQEIAVMVDRALGLVYPATHDANPQVSYTDSIPDWGKGYLKQAANAGVIQGYPNGSFGWGKQATRAEAATFVQRALTASRTGIDPQVKIRISTGGDNPQITDVPLVVPAQSINGVIYAPARSIYKAAGQVRPMAWLPESQSVFFDYDVTHQFVAGTDVFAQYMEFSPNTGPKFSAPVRMQNNELMIPVYPVPAEGHSAMMLFPQTQWDAATKTLTLTVNHVPFPIS